MLAVISTGSAGIGPSQCRYRKNLAAKSVRKPALLRVGRQILESRLGKGRRELANDVAVWHQVVAREPDHDVVVRQIYGCKVIASQHVIQCPTKDSNTAAAEYFHQDVIRTLVGCSQKNLGAEVSCAQGCQQRTRISRDRQ